MNKIVLNDYADFTKLQDRINYCWDLAFLDDIADYLTFNDIFNAATMSLKVHDTKDHEYEDARQEKLVNLIEDCFSELGFYNRAERKTS